MRVTIPQIRLIPTDTSFVRGSRDVGFELKTVSSPSEFGTQPVDENWLKKQSDFFMKLDDDSLYSAIVYTNRSHQWITPFLRSGKLPGAKELKLIVQDSQLAPLYPQIRTLVDRGVKVYGKKSLNKNMFSNSDHRKYVRDIFDDKNSPLGTRYVAFQMLLRGNDFSDRTLKMALTMYAKDIKKIFATAPPASRNMTVFRGVLSNLIGDKKIVQTKEPSSTSFSMEYAGEYSESNKGGGRIIRIDIPKGSKCLALCVLNSFSDAGEFEILLPPGKFMVVETGVVRQFGKIKATTNTMRFNK